MTTNHRVILKSRPGANGEPSKENFEYEECPYPCEELSANEVLIKTLFLSVGPVMRCCMNEDTGVHYLKPWKVGETILGTAGIGLVLSSGSDRFTHGDVVTQAFSWPWKNYAVLTTSSLEKVDTSVTGERISLTLSCLGLIGLTSLIGIWEKGRIDPASKETFVVSGAAGACGTLAGQIARLEGCHRVVGICGSDDKCHILTSTLKFDHALNYKSDDFRTLLKDACPDGIDVYFDNVGGDISDDVIALMNKNGRVILCGQISQYNKDVPYPPPINEATANIIRDKQIDRERFLVLNYADQFPIALSQLTTWLKAGKLQVFESVEKGLENAGYAFVRMMNGVNTGKMIVHVADILK